MRIWTESDRRVQLLHVFTPYVTQLLPPINQRIQDTGSTEDDWLKEN